jgi:hypothetical protein
MSRPDLYDDDIPVVHSIRDVDPPGPTASVIGLALLPLAIPILWLIIPELTDQKSIFSVGVSLAIAAAGCGLGIGAAVTEDWSAVTRLKAVLAVVILAYASAGFCYFLKKDWLEQLRKNNGRGNREWKEFTPDDRAYTVKLPGDTAPAAESPLPGWDLKTYRHEDLDRSTDVFVVAAGVQPAAAAGIKDDDAWFAAVRKGLADAAGVAEPVERALTQQGYPVREYHFSVPDRAMNRTVRVIRVGRRAVYLAVDGVVLTPESKDVKKFFDSLYIRR